MADLKAKALLNAQILEQAQMLSFAQFFLFFELATLTAAPLLLLMNKAAMGCDGEAH